METQPTQIPVKIETGVPVPEKKGFGKREMSKWSFMNTMAIGDSFSLDKKTFNVKKLTDQIRAYAYSQGYSIITRTLDNGNVRIWKAESPRQRRSGSVAG